MIEIQATLRQDLGSSASRRMLKLGYLPAILYGNNQESVPLSLEAKQITKLLHSGSLTSTLINLSFDQKGEAISHKVLIKQIQCDPVKDTIKHVEMLFAKDDGEQVVAVPIVFMDKEKCPGVKRGGYFNIIHRKIKVKCNLNIIPAKLTVKASDMRGGQKMFAKNIDLPEGVKLAIREDSIIASITGRGKTSADSDDSGKEATSLPK